VEVAGDVPETDVVTLDRVICCYPDMPELVHASIAKARSIYGIVIPSDDWLVKWVISLYYNLRFLLQRNPFRVFVHSVEAIEDIILASGFRRSFYQKSGGWLILVYSREG
jgi:magnesium-protoporphyrin O-methyltransferase